jgi:phage terminase large subunit-like protein
MDHSRLGLRLGSAVAVASTTPKTRKEIVKLIESDPKVVLTRGRTRDAIHLDDATRQSYEERYSGTRLGRQELDGELLLDVEGALWTYKLIDAGRARAMELDAIIAVLKRIVVAIDPAVTNTESSDETGIIVAGSTEPNHCPLCGDVDSAHAFVLHDASGHYGARQWAEIALRLFDEFEADEIVAEVNNGGDLVEETITAAVERSERSTVPYRDVRASRGKRTRAEPVAVLYGNVDPTLGPLRASRVHHVGMHGELGELEDQQTTWTPDDSDSPDRLDALVWALTRLLLKRRGGHSSVAG